MDICDINLAEINKRSMPILLLPETCMSRINPKTATRFPFVSRGSGQDPTTSALNAEEWDIGEEPAHNMHTGITDDIKV